jgi:hypothetical protein
MESVEQACWEPVYAMGYGVIHYPDGRTVFLQGDDFEKLDHELDNAPTNQAYLDILNQYEGIAQD